MLDSDFITVDNVTFRRSSVSRLKLYTHGSKINYEKIDGFVAIIYYLDGSQDTFKFFKNPPFLKFLQDFYEISSEEANKKADEIINLNKKYTV